MSKPKSNCSQVVFSISRPRLRLPVPYGRRVAPLVIDKYSWVASLEGRNLAERMSIQRAVLWRERSVLRTEKSFTAFSKLRELSECSRMRSFSLRK